MYQPTERRASADNQRDANINYQSWDRRQARHQQKFNYPQAAGGGGGNGHYQQHQRSAESLNNIGGGNFVSHHRPTPMDFSQVVAATVRKETGVRKLCPVYHDVDPLSVHSTTVKF